MNIVTRAEENEATDKNEEGAKQEEIYLKSL